ncbi:polymerase delta-interacting protein 2-like isoform X3 [Erpetoichthys calabaricus]|uniref:polymerase delta-interacting protein 2-like isoform X3 n=1 Tax=Erpetoichthys calabaricus TaxID=27687 RepID=UPI00109FD7D4|nr:polymerase delta-interacting protein 2-like isoform X3 [Erpetoichthys calabaricus]
MAICALRLRVAAACGLGSGSRRGLMAAAGRTFCPLAAPLSRRMSSTPRTTPRQLQQVGQLETPKKESYAAGQRAHVEAVAFLANDDDSPALYAIPGLDYANHDDILPYSSNDSRPIHHELFDHFFTATSENVSSSGTLRHTSEPLQTWQSKQQPWLKLSSIHRETTEGIRVSAMPFYMGMRETRSTRVYWWRYFIRLENLTESPVQLRERHWRIFSLSGTLETVRGRGVIGREPVLSREQPAFQYSSHVSLQSPSGHMWGTFLMERGDGDSFDCRIPPFALESRTEDQPECGRTK